MIHEIAYYDYQRTPTTIGKNETRQMLAKCKESTKKGGIIQKVWCLVRGINMYDGERAPETNYCYE